VATSVRLPMSGPELQANAIQSLMRGSPLKEPADHRVRRLDPAVVARRRSLPAAVHRATSHWVRPALLSAAITFGLLAALVAALALAFNAGWILPATYAVFGFVVAAVHRQLARRWRAPVARSCATASAASSPSRRSTP
jgi:hypothetical protein